jgi:hypothetical protein
MTKQTETNRKHRKSLYIFPDAVFGDWIVANPLSAEGQGSYKKTLCRCRCGSEKYVWDVHLRRGRSRGCGCRKYDELREKMTTHGETGTRLFTIWSGIIQRCRNPHHAGYSNYGGRGIEVCEEWADHYENFRDWSLSNGYADDLEVDRRNNNGGYEPSNCRWVTTKINNRNKRDTVSLTAFGEIKSMADWADDPRCKVGRKTLWRRIRDGWKIEDAITAEPIPNGYGYIRETN